MADDSKPSVTQADRDLAVRIVHAAYKADIGVKQATALIAQYREDAVRPLRDALILVKQDYIAVSRELPGMPTLIGPETVKACIAALSAMPAVPDPRDETIRRLEKQIEQALSLSSYTTMHTALRLACDVLDEQGLGQTPAAKKIKAALAETAPQPGAQEAK